YEGAVKEDGRGPSVWDTFSHTFGKVTDFSNADVAVDQYHRYENTQGGSLGIAFDVIWYEPATNTKEDIEAAQRAQDFQLGWFLDPLMFGDYPSSMRSRVGNRLPKFSPSEAALVKAFNGTKAIAERANSIWLYIVPQSMRTLMNYVKQKYGNPPVFITENGMDDANSIFISKKDALKDEKRIIYYSGYLSYLQAAI
ncbi:hypothetical protein TSUD_59340, partial [Trifolium subterraneum]